MSGIAGQTLSMLKPLGHRFSATQKRLCGYYSKINFIFIFLVKHA
jgi:hypothetical protein